MTKDTSKKIYTTPIIEKIVIDIAISLELNSYNPPYPNNEPSSDTFNLRNCNTDPYYTT